MPDTPSITINKQMSYRGKAEVYSNTYHFSGTTPANDAAWHTLALAIWDAEKPIHPAAVRFVGYLGYQAGNEHAVSIKNYLEDGTALPQGTATHLASVAPGDAAATIRWTTPNRTSRGKRIYLRKYFHEPDFTDDTLTNAYKTALQTYGAKMIDGTLPGGFKVCGPQGAEASNPFVAPYVTTRTLKRRGKRPSR